MTPTGGPRDTVPPKILTASPANKSVNTKPEKIVLRFDEYIVLDNPVQQVSVSPPLEGTIEFLVKGKTLEIKFPKEPLLENTTYTINFGAAIKDNNEGNIQDSFTYVFSTGAFLDSLSVTGMVVDATDGHQEEGFVVGLYTDADDSIVFRKKPDYYTKTKKDGSFRLENLKSGTFKIVTFKDENFSFTKDLATEKIAFLNEEVTPSEELVPLVLKSFSEKQPVHLTEANTKNLGVMQFIFSEAVSSFHIASFASPVSLKDTAYFFNQGRDTVLLYYTYNTQKTDSFIAVVDDKAIDTFTVNFKFNNLDSIKNALPEFGQFTPVTSGMKRQMPTVSNTEVSQDFEKPFKVMLNRPVKQFHSQHIKLLEDTLETELPFRIAQETPITLLFHVEQPETMKQGMTYQLQFADSALSDFYGTYNKPFSIKYKTTKKEDYGEAVITIDSMEADKQYILQFINGKDEIIAIEHINNRESVVYKYKKLSAGSYQLKLIEDINRNGKWDTGNYLEKRQPEPILVFPEKIDVRANWENEIVFKVNAAKPKKKVVDLEEEDE